MLREKAGFEKMIVNNWIATNLIWITLAIAVVVLIYFVFIIIQTIRKKRLRFVSQLNIVLLILGLMFLIFLTYHASEIEGADWGQIILMIGLVTITAIYASSTEKQADASLQMARQMVKPKLVPQLIRDATFSEEQSVSFNVMVHNDGQGPAYDVEQWIEDEGKPPSIIITRNQKTTVVRANDSVGWEHPIRLDFPHSDKVARRFLVIRYKDVDGEYEVRQPFVLTTVENDKPRILLESVSRKIMRKINLEDKLP